MIPNNGVSCKHHVQYRCNGVSVERRLKQVKCAHTNHIRTKCELCRVHNAHLALDQMPWVVDPWLLMDRIKRSLGFETSTDFLSLGTDSFKSFRF